MNVTQLIAVVLGYLIQAFWILILIEVIVSWIPALGVRLPEWADQLLRIVHMLTAPILNPIRRLLPNMGGLDFSPLIALLLLQFVGNAIVSALRRF